MKASRPRRRARTTVSADFGLGDVEAYCRAKPDAAASRPFGANPLVFKTAGKMFALLGTLHGEPVVSLKCDPEEAVLLRASFPNITPGYHLNKQHWNTLPLDGSLPRALIVELIDHAYELVGRAKHRASERTAAKRQASTKKRAASQRKRG